MPNSISFKMDRGRAIRNRLASAVQIAIVTALVGCPCVFLGCSPIPLKWTYQEQQRIMSPDGQVDAVVLTGDAGATTSSVGIRP